MNKNLRNTIACSIVTCMVMSTGTVWKSKVKAAEIRYNGNGRIETALKIAQSGWPNKTDYAVIAAGNDEYLIDSLIVAPLANAYDAPILLNYKGDKLDEGIINQLKSWGVNKVFIASSEKALGKGVVDQLTKLNISVERLGKDSKRETSLNIAKNLKQKLGNIDKLCIISEDASHLVDALSMAPIAGIEGMPIVLSPQNDLPGDVKSFINENGIKKCYVIGGPTVLSDNVLKASNGERIAGLERYVTNIQALDKFKNDLKFDKIYVSSGKDDHLVDALAGSVLAAKNSAPLILVGDDLGYDTKVFLRKNVESSSRVEMFGGEGAVSRVIEDNVDSILYGEESGLLKVQSVSAINSSLVKVVLNHKVREVDKSQLLFSDESDKNMSISSIEMAPWDSSNQTVLVTLKDAMAAGKLYTVNSEKFPGPNSDSAKPVITELKSTDYNKVEIAFSQPVRINDLKMNIFEKYNTSSKLKVIDKQYIEGDPTRVEITTDDQKESTLYSTEVHGAVDFANKAVDKDDSKTFVGTPKDTVTKLSIVSVQPLDPKNVMVTFNTKVDTSKVNNLSSYSVGEAYDSITRYNVVGARMATSEDDALMDKDTLRKTIVITLDSSMRDSTVYRLALSGLTTTTGVGLDNITSNNTFIGVGPYTSKMDMTDEGNVVTAVGSKKVRITFKRHMNKNMLLKENFNIFKINENNAPMDIKSINVLDDRNIELEVAGMNKALYKLTLNNLVDVDNNTFEIGKNSKIFEGKDQSGSLRTITSAVLQPDNVSLIITFDSSVGLSASDVSHYSIDNGIGYPSRAEIVAGHPNQVRLIIPKTITGKIYKVTASKLENADGDPMDSSGITASFVGAGVSATLPEVQSVVASDRHTLQITFDRSVKDGSIDGEDKIWISSLNRMASSAVTIYGKYTKTLGLSNIYVSADKENPNILIIRSNSIDFNYKSAKNDGNFEIKIKGTTNNESHMQFSSNDEEMAPIVIESVTALNKKSVRVKFNKPVKIEKNADFGRVVSFVNSVDASKVYSSYNSSNSSRLINPTPVDPSYTTYDFALSNGNLNTNLYSNNWLVVNSSLSYRAGNGVHDYTDWQYGGFVTLMDEDTSKSGIQQAREFSGSNEEPGTVNNIPVMMRDSKTIEIYYPEAMNTADGSNAASVLDKRNYKLVDRSGNQIGGNFFLIHVCDISYDRMSNKVTISLNSQLPPSNSGYCMQFAKTLQNGLGTKLVKKSSYEDAELRCEFATNAKEADKVRVSSDTSYTASTRTLNIKLSQKATSVAAYDKVILMADFKITVVDSDGQNYVLKDSDIYSVNTTISDSYSNASDTITVVLKDRINGNKTLRNAAAGKVEFIPNNSLRGVNGEGVENSSSTVFVQ